MTIQIQYLYGFPLPPDCHLYISSPSSVRIDAMYRFIIIKNTMILIYEFFFFSYLFYFKEMIPSELIAKISNRKN